MSVAAPGSGSATAAYDAHRCASASVSATVAARVALHRVARAHGRSPGRTRGRTHRRARHRIHVRLSEAYGACGVHHTRDKTVKSLFIFFHKDVDFLFYFFEGGE